MTGKDPIQSLAEGLHRRMRDVILVAQRIEDYTFGPAETEAKRAALREGDAEALAHDMVLRALRLASDTSNWGILDAVAGQDQGCLIDDLAARCGLPRLAATERANELIQAGLCHRAIDADRLVATQAGLALVELVAAIAGELARRTKQGAGKERAIGEHSLPVL